MKMADIFNISLKNLLRNRSRTIINSLILALGIIVLLMTISLSSGIKDIAEKQILQTRTMREITVLEDSFSSIQKQIDFNQLDNFKNIEHVDIVYPDVQMMVGLYDNYKWLGAGNVRGILKLCLPPLLEGKAFSDNDKNVVIIPEKMSIVDGIANGKDFIGKQMQIEYNIVGKNGQQDTKKYNARVVGVYSHTKGGLPPNALFIPIDDMYKLSAENKGLTKESYKTMMTFTSANIVVEEEKYVEPISLLIEDQGFVTNSINKELSRIPGSVKFLVILGSLISFIVFISSSISIGATMLQATKNRVKEIGLMKAVGFYNKTVLKIFLLESILTGLLGGIIGIVIAQIGLFITEKILLRNQSFEGISLTISLTSVAVAGCVCLIVPYIGSIFPIKKASKVSPSEALRSE